LIKNNSRFILFFVSMDSVDFGAFCVICIVDLVFRVFHNSLCWSISKFVSICNKTFGDEVGLCVGIEDGVCVGVFFFPLIITLLS
jgi:hypothetical protein